MKTMILAGGCFWGMEAYYSRLKGITATTVGYTDGPTEHPTYREVCQSIGHVEAIHLTYDESVLSLEKILEHFVRIVDVTQVNRQMHDVGIQYRNAVFFTDPGDEAPIRTYLESYQKKIGRPIATYVKAATPFYPAEEYHQQYLEKNPGGYCHINLGLLKPEERR
jgi:methionine-S-sulfoxide reductase